MTQTVPASMKAIEISEPGGPDMLRPCTRPVPQPGEGEVLVKVAAAGVNYPDVAQRRGNYPPPPGASDLPGLEISGTVAALGPDASGPAPGDEVCALVSGGGYAEYCAVPVPQCLPIPDGLDTVRAAALPETFFTVWTNLFDGGRMKAGETVLIHGGSGGIGTAAIQIARAFGARVFATARTPEKCAFCEELGAERAIVYAEEDFVAVVRELTEKRGVDLILDMVGGDYLARNVRALAVEGRLVQIAVREGAEATIPLGLLMVKRLVLTGSTLRPRTVAQKGAIAAALEREVWPLLAEGSVRPVVHATFALDEAAEAHALMESSAHIGKIVLTV